MKRSIITLFLAFAILPVFAQNAWTVDMVPNTRLQSNNIHVSDPDGYISDEYEMRINTALCSIRNEADVFLVCLSTIGSDDPQVFRNDLFNKWGIGDKGKDNGMLMLFVEDQHAFEYETGYGIEGVMPDVKCMQIFENTIKPCFKKGDYEGGMYAGVLDIVEVFGGTMPDNLITDLPDEEVYATVKAEKDKETMSDFYMWITLILCLFIPGVAALRFFTHIKEEKKLKNTEIKDTYKMEVVDGVNYISEIKNTWTGSAWQGKGCSKALTFGLSGIAWFFVFSVLLLTAMDGEEEIYINNWIAAVTIIVYLSWICWRHNSRSLKMADKVAKDSIFPKKIYESAKNYRRTKYVNIIAPWLGYFYRKKYEKRETACPEMRCPTCHADMTADAEPILSDKQAFEDNNDIRKYMSLRCREGHAFYKVENGKNYSKYKDCVTCGAHAMKLTGTKVVDKPTYSSNGVDENTYMCQFCGAVSTLRVIVPRLERPTTSSYSSGSSHHSSHSSGGSFGGGRSGGGGYSGRW